MKKYIVLMIVSMVLASCGNEFNRVCKSSDTAFRYEYAKECFARGRYEKAITLLSDLITMQKGTDNAQESLYMLAMAYYNDGDYESASLTFKRYTTSYPKGVYAEAARFHIGKALYMSTPEPRLDQTPTIAAIGAFQEYLDLYPEAIYKDEAQNLLFELQEKLIQKELYTSELYYNLGQYFGNCTNGGNNYEACIITAQNALKDYPYTSLREQFTLLVMKSKYELAQQSIEEKQLERFQDAEDECYGFINEFPESKNVAVAEKYISKCKQHTHTTN